MGHYWDEISSQYAREYCLKLLVESKSLDNVLYATELLLLNNDDDETMMMINNTLNDIHFSSSILKETSELGTKSFRLSQNLKRFCTLIPENKWPQELFNLINALKNNADKNITSSFVFNSLRTIGKRFIQIENNLQKAQ